MLEAFLPNDTANINRPYWVMKQPKKIPVPNGDHSKAAAISCGERERASVVPAIFHLEPDLVKENNTQKALINRKGMGPQDGKRFLEMSCRRKDFVSSNVDSEHKIRGGKSPGHGECLTVLLSDESRNNWKRRLPLQQLKEVSGKASAAEGGQWQGTRPFRRTQGASSKQGLIGELGSAGF